MLSINTDRPELRVHQLAIKNRHLPSRPLENCAPVPTPMLVVKHWPGFSVALDPPERQHTQIRATLQAQSQTLKAVRDMLIAERVLHMREIAAEKPLPEVIETVQLMEDVKSD